MKNLIACTLITVGLAAIVLPIYYMIYPALVILLFIFGCYAVGGGIELLAMDEATTGEKCISYLDYVNKNLDNVTYKEYVEIKEAIKRLNRTANTTVNWTVGRNRDTDYNVGEPL